MVFLKDNLKKKFINVQEENKRLRKEYSEKSEKIQNDYAIGELLTLSTAVVSF